MQSLPMDHFDFQEELEDQKRQLIEQYGEDIAVRHWNGEDYYDGENINPPSYRWYHHVVTSQCHFSKCHTSSWLRLGWCYYIREHIGIHGQHHWQRCTAKSLCRCHHWRHGHQGPLPICLRVSTWWTWQVFIQWTIAWGGGLLSTPTWGTRCTTYQIKHARIFINSVGRLVSIEHCALYVSRWHTARWCNQSKRCAAGLVV